MIIGNTDLLLDDIFDEFLFSSDRRGNSSNDIVNSRSIDQAGTHSLTHLRTTLFTFSRTSFL